MIRTLARLQGDYTANVAAYDEIHVQILHMADMLSDGIMGQYPSAVSRKQRSNGRRELVRAARHRTSEGKDR